jgi:hypothetical protein
MRLGGEKNIKTSLEIGRSAETSAFGAKWTVANDGFRSKVDITHQPKGSPNCSRIDDHRRVSRLFLTYPGWLELQVYLQFPRLGGAPSRLGDRRACELMKELAKNHDVLDRSPLKRRDQVCSDIARLISIANRLC